MLRRRASTRPAPSPSWGGPVSTGPVVFDPALRTAAELVDGTAGEPAAPAARRTAVPSASPARRPTRRVPATPRPGGRAA